MEVAAFSRLCLANTGFNVLTTEVSPAIFMMDASSVSVSVILSLFSSGGGFACVLWIEQSNDAQNWTAVGSPIEVDEPGHFWIPPVFGVATACVRVKAELTDDIGSGTDAILAASVFLGGKSKET